MKKMWKNILQKSMSEYAKKLVDKVIDSEPRTVEELLDMMYDEVERQNKQRIKTRHLTITGGHSIPTRKELGPYLNKNYNSALFDIANRQVKYKTPDIKRRYWK